MKYFYGILLCVLIGVASLLLAPYIPIGSVAIAIIIGIFVGNLFKPGEKFSSGIKFSEKHILSFAIALLGVNLNFLILKQLGLKSILLIILAMTFTISTSVLLGKLFKFKRKFALLLGIGNAVCGSSAIAATEKIIGSEEEEVGLSVAIVNFLGTIGIFLLPFIGKVVLHFSKLKTGILIGNTLQAVGQVVAAGFSVSDITGQTATIVKMTRILMLTPLIIILILAFSKNKKNNTEIKAKKNNVPIFIIGFALFSLIPTFSLLPEHIIKIISKISHYSLIIAMAGIGMKITFKSIAKDGKVALIIGSLTFLMQIIFSGSMIFFFFK